MGITQMPDHGLMITIDLMVLNPITANIGFEDNITCAQVGRHLVADAARIDDVVGPEVDALRPMRVADKN